MSYKASVWCRGRRGMVPTLSRCLHCQGVCGPEGPATAHASAAVSAGPALLQLLQNRCSCYYTPAVAAAAAHLGRCARRGRRAAEQMPGRWGPPPGHPCQSAAGGKQGAAVGHLQARRAGAATAQQSHRACHAAAWLGSHHLLLGKAGVRQQAHHAAANKSTSSCTVNATAAALAFGLNTFCLAKPGSTT